MEFSDAIAIPAPARFSIAGGFVIAVILVSIVDVPQSVAQTGPLGLYGIDKWVHAGSYAMIALLLAYASLTKRVLVLIVIACVTVLLGIGVEFIQSTVPSRSMESADIVANSVGTVVALMLWKIR